MTENPPIAVTGTDPIGLAAAGRRVEHGFAPNNLNRTAMAAGHKAARDVDLVLPETDACSSNAMDGEVLDENGECCGGPAPDTMDACCKRDADAKAAGGDGCGCGCGALSSNRTARAETA